MSAVMLDGTDGWSGQQMADNSKHAAGGDRRGSAPHSRVPRVSGGKGAAHTGRTSRATGEVGGATGARSSGKTSRRASTDPARVSRSGVRGQPAGPRVSQRRSAPTSAATRGPARRGQPASAAMLVPEGVDILRLERSVRAELRSLAKPNADAVAAHLVTAADLLDTDPVRALAHARAARARAARVAAVREAVGIAAYHAGEWAEAINELRTARRISGDPRNLPVLADCERALGRPGQAVRMLSDPDANRLDSEGRLELLIVVAGARRDLGQLDAALAVLARGGLDRERPRPGSARLWYAYADALAAAGRSTEAAQWFAASAAVDPDGELDAVDRAAALL